jgi:RNA recognition motif-containing protein
VQYSFLIFQQLEKELKKFCVFVDFSGHLIFTSYFLGYACMFSFSVVKYNLLFTGYAFIYFFDERDGEDAIRGLDNMPFGYGKRKLTVEWSKVTNKSPFNHKMLSFGHDG